MKYWGTSSDRKAQGQWARKLSSLFCLKHRLTGQNNGIIKTFSVAKDHIMLWRETLGTELCAINYKNMALIRMKGLRSLPSQTVSKTGSELGGLSVWSRITSSAVSQKQKNFVIWTFFRRRRCRRMLLARGVPLGICFHNCMPFCSLPYTQHRADYFCSIGFLSNFIGLP